MKLKILGIDFRVTATCVSSPSRMKKARNELIDSEVLTGASICNLSNSCWGLNVNTLSK
jgi:hypothetical protein